MPGRQQLQTLRHIPDSDFLSTLDTARREIESTLSRAVPTVAGARSAEETEARWREFLAVLVGLMAVGGPVQESIVQAARGAVRATNLLDGDGPGALAGAPVPSEQVQQAIERRAQRQSAQYLAERSGTVIQQIDRKTARGLRHLLTEEELGDVEAPRRVVAAVGALVGLTTHQGKSFIKELVRQVSERKVRGEAGVMRLFRKHAERRAKTIVSNEAAEAANAGMRSGFEALRDEGDIPIMGLDGVFISDTGERSRGPLLHANCRCVTRLVKAVNAYWLEWVTRIFGVCPRCIAFDAKLRGWETTEFRGKPSPFGDSEGDSEGGQPVALEVR